MAQNSAQVDAEQASFARFLADAAGDEELVVLGAAEGDIAGGDIAAVVLADELSARIEHLHLLHSVMGDVQIARRVEADAVGLALQMVAAWMPG